MSNPNNRAFENARAQGAAIDHGLRQYMLKIYNHMFVGLAITGLVAFFASQNMQLMQFLHGGFSWVLMIGMLAMAFMLPMKINKMRASTAQTLFLVYAFMMGLFTSYIFLVYTSTSIGRVFLITSATFGAMSLYGYTTKKDLSGMGSFLYMALIGIVIASLVNMFMQSSGMSFMISIFAVLIFTGLTAYDTQKLKEIYFAQDTLETTEKKAILGAFTLYLDFINLFLHLLRLLGDRR